MPVMHLYLDESGARHPDHQPPAGWEANCHWFAIGGVLLSREDEVIARAAIRQFRASWPQLGEIPLHSYEIRNRRDGFHWLNDLPPPELDRFLTELGELLCTLPTFVCGCVIDGPGYNQRYAERYGAKRWLMCRTAFAIAVERAAKHAKALNCRLRVFVEGSDPQTEDTLRGYYEALRKDAHPFQPDQAAGYEPLTPEDYAAILLEFRPKQKSSPLMQIADLALWPICKGGYDSGYPPYQLLLRRGRLLDCLYPGEVAIKGIKYSCFDAWREYQNKTPLEAG